MRVRDLLLACVVVNGLCLFAAQASDGLPQGTTAALAAAEEETAALVAFQQTHQGVKFSAEGGRIVRVYDATLGVGESPEDAAASFLSANAVMLGVEKADLAATTPILPAGNTLPLMYDEDNGTYKLTLVYYSQYRDGVPVFRSDVRLLVRNEPGHALVWVGSSLKRLGAFRPDFSGAVVTDPTQVAADMTTFTTVEPVIWAGVDDQVVEPVLAWTFQASNEGSGSPMSQKWLYVVDAATGDVLYKENLIVFTDVTGSVHGLATTLPKSDVCNPEVDTVMKYAKVAIGSTTAYANANGDFTIPNSGSSAVTVTSYVAGQYFTVSTSSGSLDTLTQSVTPPGPANFVHNSDNTSETIRAQVNAYVQANMVRDWVLAQNPSYPTISTQTNFSLKVNRSDLYCPGNAWYDGSALNFCKASGSYPNTAFSNVVHHEYGHHIVQCGGSGQGQYGEGMGDCVAVCIADDPVLGYGFTGNCSAGIRTANNTRQYPCTSDDHTCAQLLSGCVWSTRNQLITGYPSTYLSILSKLTLNSVPMHSGTQITPQICTDWITLDNNYYGGAHVAQINAGFAAHNMAPADTTPPTPNPMTFSSAPAPASSSSITMTATTATDATSPPVSYYFHFVSGGTGGTDSAWQSSTTYTDTGLAANTSYTYQVKARDSASTPNETSYSSSFSAVTWANVPTAPALSGATLTTLNLDVNANGNPAATEFAVQCTSSSPSDSAWTGKYVSAGGTPSAAAVWRTEAQWGVTTVTGLQSCTSYTFAVKARNSESVETAFGPGASLGTSGRQGDLNGDGVVDGEDIQPFVNCAISGGSGCACANVSIAAFVDCLLNPGVCP